MKRFLGCMAVVLLINCVCDPSLASALQTKTKDQKSVAKPATLPKAVDLRPQFIKYGLLPRSQGPRNTCSVFTTAGAMEFALSKQLGQGAPLSVEYLNWACNQVIKNQTEDRGQFFHDLLKGFEEHGICLEVDMPYQKQFNPKFSPTAQATTRAKEVLAKKLKIHWINPWKKDPGLTDGQLVEIKEVLAKGWPVAAGSSHSRLLVGYVDDSRQPGGGIFITRDSGTAVFDVATYDFVKSKVGDVFWVEAELKTAVKKK